MQRLLYTAMFALVLVNVSAQDNNQYLVKAGEIPEKAIPNEVIYALPAFKEGSAILRNGAKSNHRFNYNCLLDELQFLTVTGDTLSIAEPELLQKVLIDSTTYYFQKGYLKQLIRDGKFTLAVNERLLQADSKKQAAYGGSSSTSAIDNYSNIYGGGRMFKLEVKRDYYFRKVQHFFLGNVYDQFIRADKRGFYELFPGKRTQIGDYIKQQKINFNDQGDVKKLFLFCTGT